MMKAVARPSLLWSGPVFLLGLIALFSVLAPFTTRGSRFNAALVIAVIPSILFSVAYMIGVRTFLSGYSRRSLTLTFGPFILATIGIGVVALVWVIMTLAYWNIL